MQYLFFLNHVYLPIHFCFNLSLNLIKIYGPLPQGDLFNYIVHVIMRKRIITLINNYLIILIDNETK